MSNEVIWIGQNTYWSFLAIEQSAGWMYVCMYVTLVVPQWTRRALLYNLIVNFPLCQCTEEEIHVIVAKYMYFCVTLNLSTLAEQKVCTLYVLCKMWKNLNYWGHTKSAVSSLTRISPFLKLMSALNRPCIQQACQQEETRQNVTHLLQWQKVGEHVRLVAYCHTHHMPGNARLVNPCWSASSSSLSDAECFWERQNMQLLGPSARIRYCFTGLTINKTVILTDRPLVFFN